MKGFCIGAFLAAGTRSAKADVFVTDIGAGTARDGYTQNETFSGTIGTNFTCTQTEIVTQLGVWDGPNSASGTIGDGLLESHQVGLWSSGGALLASVTVTAGGGTLIGDFRYVTLSSPITLAAGQSFDLGAYVDTNPSGDSFWNPVNGAGSFGSFVGNPSQVNNADGTGFGFPGNSAGNPTLGLFGPSLIATVPEPGSLTILGVAGLAMLGRRRHQPRFQPPPPTVG
jgi:hypothetical protein